VIRFALHVDVTPASTGWALLATAVFVALAIWGYDPARGMMKKRS